MKKFSACIVISVLFALLIGCATTQNLSSANRATLHTVFVEPNAPTPDNVIYFGAGQNLAAIGGMIGALAAYPSAQNSANQIKNTLSKNNINISKIVATEFSSQLKRQGIFSVTTNERQADAILKLQVQQFGLYERAPLSSQVRPIIAISATLINKNNEVIWKDTEQVNVLNSPAQAYSLSEFLNNPALLKNGFEAASVATVNKLINNLNSR